MMPSNVPSANVRNVIFVKPATAFTKPPVKKDSKDAKKKTAAKKVAKPGDAATTATGK